MHDEPDRTGAAARGPGRAVPIDRDVFYYKGKRIVSRNGKLGRQAGHGMLMHHFGWRKLGGRFPGDKQATGPTDTVTPDQTGRTGPVGRRSCPGAVVGLSVLIVLAVGQWPGSASAQPAVAWKTGDGLRAALAQPAGVTWEHVPLRDHLHQLACAHHVCIFLDRRIDPSQRITFQAQEIPFATALRQLARQIGARVTLLDSVVYLGPEPAVAKLTFVAAARRRDAAHLVRGIRRRVVQRRAWHWEDLTVPRQLVSQLAEQGGVDVDELDRVPYDLWPAADLPKLVWTDCLSLVLAGFDLSFEFTGPGREIRLVPFPETLPPGVPRGNWPTLSKAAGSTHAAPGVDQTRYTMTVAGHPLGAVLKTLETRSGLTFAIDSSAAKKLTTIVKFSVREATLDQLLGAALRPAGLTFQRRGKRIEVVAP